MQRYRVGLFVVILFIVSGCATRREKTQAGDAETHFLRYCKSDCEAPLSCICGICTTVCDADDPCQELSDDSECMTIEALRATGRCGDADLPQESICDMGCKSDADCDSLGEGFTCVSGFCREKGDAGSGSTDSSLKIPREAVECRNPTDSQSSCLSSTVVMDQDVNRVEKIDLLFVIDNSVSMQQEQEKLRAQIPRMIKVLTTGDKTPDDGVENMDFPPAKDLHLAVVSSDMGLPGLAPEENPDDTYACNETGDDGNFLNDPSQAIAADADCPGVGAGGYPIFLEHIREDREDTSVTLQRAQATADAFGCIATLGTLGCGYEMPLESALKALWPSQPGNLSETHQNLEISFLAGSQGHGDNRHKSFLRGTPYHPTEADELSLLAIIVVTDEDDCSAGAQGDLQFLSRNSVEDYGEDGNLACYYDTLGNWGNKYPVERYIEGFKALRPGFPDLVIFSAIVGIPTVIPAEDANGDNDISAEEREDYYDQILNHPLMQETPDPRRTNNLNYSCAHETSSGVLDTQAYPARRFTEVAKGFGPNGIVRSICDHDFTPAMNAIIDVISNKIGGVCLPRDFKRDSSGMIGCDIIWTMPEDWSCDDYSYLDDPPPGKPQYDESGRKRCVVNQIPVINPDATDPAKALGLSQNNELGWYYDDFSEDMERTCKLTETIVTKQRISFSLNPGMNGQNEDPPSGVSIDLECLQQIEKYYEGFEPVGVPCEDASPEACPLPPVEPGALFCSEISDTCELHCRDNDDCPTDWICDDRQHADGTFINQSSYPICIDPICDLPEGSARYCGNSDVGEACVPFYNGTFNSNEIYIETNSPSCETGICGIFRFSGDPQRIVPPSPSADQLQDHVFCTCRCRASDPETPTCTCPDGFECSEDLLSLAGPGLAGGYCVRKDTLDTVYTN